MYVLATITALAPLLGLLGTVWGVLHALSHVQGAGNQAMLNGISLALTTTVIGLLTAIPALIGYHFLKSQNRHFEVDMETFGYEILSWIEKEYRQADLGET